MSPVPQTHPKSAFREGMWMGMLCLLVSICGLVIVYRLADRALVQGLQKHLEDLARLAATEIDGDAHQQLANSAVAGSPEYTNVSTPLLRIRKLIPEVYYAYTLVMRDGRPVFVLDTSYFIKNRGDETVVAMPGDVYQDAPPELFQAWEHHQAVSSESPYTDQWGTFLSSFAPFRNRNGEVVGIVGLDVTMEHMAERRRPAQLAFGIACFACLFGSTMVGVLRARAYGRIAQREGELIVARADAQRGERAARVGEQIKGVFLATMSHEIRTPLNGVLGMADALSHTPLNPEQSAQVTAIRDSGRVLMTMLNDILDFSKSEVGSLSIHPVVMPLQSVIDEVTGLYRASAGNKGLSLTVHCAADAPCHVMADPARVCQVLGNLISNAIKFTEQGGIAVNVRKGPQGMAEISIEDTGIGIPEDRLKDLFMPFSQLDSALNRAVGGAGLGLAISKRLTEFMGGVLSVKSQPGRGSCFSVLLPVAEPSTVVVSTTQSVSSDPVQIPASLRVLVAEDVEINRKVVGHFFKRLGIEPIFAEDGEQAVRLWREHRPDVILMDVQMPLIDGREATRRIRAESADPVVPWIIALTGGVMGDDRADALESGMNDFLSKPIDMGALTSALAKASSFAS